MVNRLLIDGLRGTVLADRSMWNTVTAFDLPHTYVVYDLETTGLIDSLPVQYGALKIVDDNEAERFETLVKLPNGKHIEPDAARVNHISECDLIGAPTQEEAYRAFANFVGNFPLIGFNNRNYDDLIINSLASEFGLSSLTNNHGPAGNDVGQDVQYLYMKIRPMGFKPSLAKVCEAFGIVNPHAHDAMGDVVATNEAYQEIVRVIQRNSSDVRDIEAVTLSNELEGEVICVSGGSNDEKRSMELLAKSMGADLHPRVTKKVTLCILLNDEDTGNSKKARAYGIPVMKGFEFMNTYNKRQDDIDRAEGKPVAGCWESELDEVSRKNLRRELGLPITKPLVWAHVATTTEHRVNSFGVELEVQVQRYATDPVKDIRIARKFENDGTVLLDVMMSNGDVRKYPVNAAYFATMQAEGKFMSNVSE